MGSKRSFHTAINRSSSSRVISSCGCGTSWPRRAFRTSSGSVSRYVVCLFDLWTTLMIPAFTSFTR